MSRTHHAGGSTTQARHSSGARLPWASLAAGGGWRPIIVVSVLAGALLFGAATVAWANAPVVFSDPNLRAAVASQLSAQGQIPAGSDGTAITPSDMQAIITMSAPGSGIVGLDGLQHAVNLTSLDLSGNEIATMTPLAGLTDLAELDVSRNRLDVTAGSPAMSVITTLEGLGARVSYQPQRAALFLLAVSPSAAKYGKVVTFSASIAPRGAAASGASELRLYRLETKTVTKLVKGKKKKVKVDYWRPHSTLAMQGSSTSGLSVQGKPPHAGKWQAQVAYAGSADYESCTSTVSTFVVQDPRIEKAISWAMHRLGSHAWDHHCLKFVNDAYARGAGAGITRYPTARQAAGALRAAANPGTNAPRGAYVFFHSKHGSTDLGHAGISLGNGTMINSYGGQGVKIISIKKCTLHYIGWAAPPLSPAISDWSHPTGQ